VRLASPSDAPTRLLVGAFCQRQSNDIFQNYLIDNLGPLLSVNGNPGTLWLTKQKRVDRDYAVFGELSHDFGSKVTATLGARVFRFDNSLFGFFGFGRNPAYVQGASGNPAPNAAGSSRTGVAGCYTTTGATLRNAQLAGTTTALITEGRIAGTPCTNLAEFRDGKLVPKSTKGNGVTYRANVQYKPSAGLMFYATYSRGFRPGGINRRAEVPAYAPDYLDNMEIGWKTTFANSAIRWNGAVFSQRWKKFQFSYLGANSFTEIRNGSDARINGIETDINYIGHGLTLNAAASVTDAKTLSNICNAFDDDSACSGSFIAAPKGTRLPITPRFKSTATARYAFPIAGYKAHVQAGLAYHTKASASIRQQIELVGTLERVNPNDYIGVIRSSTLVDVAAGVDFRRFTAELFAQNLFDQRNVLSRGVACSSCQRPQLVVGTPRVIGLRLGTRF
jgi:outer membrane receptor protein involved in Fe transport